MLSMDTEPEAGVGRVLAIFLAQATEGERIAVDAALAVAGCGLKGDAYFAGSGTRHRDDRDGHDLTLISAEALDALASETGIRLEAHEPRRNIVTRGIALNDLVGQRFRIGDLVCLGRRLCHPCSHLQGLMQPGVLRGLVNRGGLRADVLSDGWIRIGDEIHVLGEAASVEAAR
jgi:MOSC domain-containing protein YiiM